MRLEFCLVLLLFISLAGCKSDSLYGTVDSSSEFQLNVAESIYKDGIAIINGSYRIPYDCPLDLGASKIKNGMKIASYFNLDDQKMIPAIGDLKPKYIMLKRKSEDIIYGIKVGDTLAFKLIDYPKKAE